MLTEKAMAGDAESLGLTPGAGARPARRMPEMQPHQSLTRILRLLHNVNVRLSLFVFDTLPGTIESPGLLHAVQSAVDDSGFAFELDDGRIGALFYGWRPARAQDSWVERRIHERLEWSLGGRSGAADLVDVRAIHCCSTEIACPAEIPALLMLASPLCAAATAGTA
ncbi:MAG: hypothetical protein WD470_11185 [Rhodospirillaceae bacterium]